MLTLPSAVEDCGWHTRGLMLGRRSHSATPGALSQFLTQGTVYLLPDTATLPRHLAWRNGNVYSHGNLYTNTARGFIWNS